MTTRNDATGITPAVPTRTQALEAGINLWFDVFWNVIGLAFWLLVLAILVLVVASVFMAL